MRLTQIPSKPESKRVYFPGLNALRVYAALSVVIIHIPGYGFGDVTLGNAAKYIQEFFQLFFLTGQDAVTLFFCLSGFLITYLLLDEQVQHGMFSFKRFYLRRTTRIWPLYYLILITGLLITLIYSRNQPPLDTFSLVTLLFLSGHIGSAFGGLGVLGPLWSIGIEEWFYMAWPPILHRFTVPRIFIGIITIRLILILIVYPPHVIQRGLWDANPAAHLISLMRFECMAVGALGAWIYTRRNRILRLIYRYELLFWVLFMMLIVISPETSGGFFYDLSVAFISIGLILNVATNPERRINIERPVLKQLGQISYGIYMYHSLVIHVVCGAFLAVGLGNAPVQLILLYFTIPLITVTIAWISYHLFEKRVNPPTVLDAKALRT